MKTGQQSGASTFLALVAAIRQWAASLTASHSFIHATTGSNIEATDSLMKAAGAKLLGGHMWFELNDRKCP